MFMKVCDTLTAQFIIYTDSGGYCISIPYKCHIGYIRERSLPAIRIQDSTAGVTYTNVCIVIMTTIAMASSSVNNVSEKTRMARKRKLNVTVKTTIRKRDRKLLFCDHCQQFLPKSTFYSHKRFYSQLPPERRCKEVSKEGEVFEISSNEEDLCESDITETFELSGSEEADCLNDEMDTTGMHIYNVEDDQEDVMRH